MHITLVMRIMLITPFMLIALIALIMLVLAQRIFSVMFPSSSSSLIIWSDFSH